MNITQTACIYFTEDELNKFLGKFDDEQDSILYQRVREARMNIFRY